ncbi:hypothetical protein LTR70_003369 [Exophiala xenobiotica]|uniref:Cyclase n=1 Tax=Lithohypha guttulata TaxID=1690604 RepID=A0ABR0KG99_9EURO|nr:hypothetical protein LTR24_002917 [Lithohypha guttulata]KAK5323507.1 hypothetical protein LTR70_003369 [Exophiala xenobiotica]
MHTTDLPTYQNLPTEDQSGYKCSWGLFDKDGVKDEVGTVNLLTPEVVAEAAKEVKLGKSVSLNWGLEKMHKPFGARLALNHKFIDWRQKEGFDFYCYDDEVNVNTQSGSQWDGLRHWGHSKTGLYYNGVHHDKLLQSGHLGIEQWSKRGGIVGRGVLLDYCHWAEKAKIEFNPMSGHKITIADLEAIAKDEAVTLQPGDILVVRTGFLKWYEEHSEELREKYITNGKAWIGVEGSERTLEWLWNNHFAAVVGDNIGFEVWPPTAGYSLHDHLLSLWGMPIGELWDLEGLSEQCGKQNRWSFFLTSAPLNVTGGYLKAALVDANATPY